MANETPDTKEPCVDQSELGPRLTWHTPLVVSLDAASGTRSGTKVSSYEDTSNNISNGPG